MKLKHLISPLVVVLFLGCKQQPSINGLWIVKKVSIGAEEMTPNARWMRFNEDHTQESGNGWFQHSVGTWSLDSKTQQLVVKNTNGLSDPYEPFKVVISDTQMTWTRTESGAEVEVRLERADELPTTLGDQLLGLWKLETADGEGDFFNSISNDNAFLFLRWDKRFVIGSSQGRLNGVYNVHGHNPEIELIPYKKELERSFWKVKIEKNKIQLSLLNSDSAVTRSFIRTDKFPQ